MDGPPEAARSGKLKYAFVAPTLVFLLAFNVFPLAYNLVLGFTDAELVGSGWRWRGTANYARVFGDPEFAQAVRRTASFVSFSSRSLSRRKRRHCISAAT